MRVHECSRCFDAFFFQKIETFGAVARLSEQTRQVPRAPKVQASTGAEGMLPQKILKSTLSEMLFSASFHEIFLQNSILFKCFQHFLYPLLGRVPDWHQADGYPEFRIALIHPHPLLPAPLLAMAGFQYLSHANTLLLQDYHIQLQLRTLELFCGPRENFIS